MHSLMGVYMVDPQYDRLKKKMRRGKVTDE